jgi:large-conductance mechanosensitive channel
MVEDILMPAIGMIFGAPDFSAIKLGALEFGKFMNAAVNFIFIAAALFVLVKIINTLMKTGMGTAADEDAMKDGIKDALKKD